MALSVAVTTVLVTCLALGAVCQGQDTISNMGPCNSDISGEPFDFEEFATANGGVWYIALVPKGYFSDDIKTAGLRFKPVDDGGIDFNSYRRGVYFATIFTINKSGNEEIFSTGTMTFHGNGRATAASYINSTGKENLYFYRYLKIDPGKMVYCYICSNVGGDKTTDYRYVLVTKKPTEAEIKKFREMDKSKEFKKPLIKLEVPA